MFARIPHRHAPWNCGSIIAGRGAARLYSSEVKTPPTAYRKGSNDLEKSGGKNEGQSEQLSKNDYDDLPEHGSVDATLYDDFHDLDELAEIPAYRLGGLGEDAKKPTQAPVGTPYTTALTAAFRAERHARQVEKTLQEDQTGKTVHILGYNPAAYFFAHQLAGYEFLNPPKVLIHNSIVWNNWLYEGERVSLFMGGRQSVRKRVEAEWIGTGKRLPVAADHIEQLIVTMNCANTKKAIENIATRIDERTTILLVQDGLGMVEELCETLFTDPARRPTFLLGNSSATIWYHKPIFFSSVLAKPGKLYLTALERGLWAPNDKIRNGNQFLRTLVGTHGLGAGGYSMENFLLNKFPKMVFNCIVEPMAIALDTKYENVLRNEHAILLADDLLQELFNVIWALPELTNSVKLSQFCGMDPLRKYTLRRLAKKGPAMSDMVSMVRAGRMPDIDYLNGYFIGRGKELGIKMPQNEMMMEVVKGRVMERSKQLKGLVPFDGLDEPVAQ